MSRGYGASCIESVQCSTKLEAGGQCNNSICNCAEGFHYFKGQCWKTSGENQQYCQNIKYKNIFSEISCNVKHELSNLFQSLQKFQIIITYYANLVQYRMK